MTPAAMVAQMAQFNPMMAQMLQQRLNMAAANGIAPEVAMQQFQAQVMMMRQQMMAAGGAMGMQGMGMGGMGMGGMGMPGAGGMGGQSGGGGGGTGIAFSSQANVPPADRKSQ